MSTQIVSVISLVLFGALSAQAAEQSYEQANSVAVSLQDATQIAVGRSFRIRQSEAERNAQVEKRRGSWAEVGPRVKGEYNEIHLREPVKASFGPQPITIRPELTRNAALTIAQPITGAAALITKAKFEGKQEDLKDLKLRQTRAEVAFQASELWLKAFEMKRQLEIADFAVKVASSQASDAQAMERAGRLNHADSLRLQLAVSEARSGLARAKAGNDIALAALREVLGLRPDVKIDLKGGLPKLSNPPDLSKALNTAFENRLERKQAALGVVLAEYGKKFAYTQYMPSVNAFAKAEHNMGQLPLGAQAYQHTYGITASWDLWSNGSSAFAVREAAQNAVAAEEGRRSVDNMIRIDVQQAVAAFSAAEESLAAASQAVTQAEEVYRIQSVRFKTGAILSSELLLAQNARDAAQVRLATAETDLVLSSLKTQKALGVEAPQL